MTEPFENDRPEVSLAVLRHRPPDLTWLNLNRLAIGKRPVEWYELPVLNRVYFRTVRLHPVYSCSHGKSSCRFCQGILKD